MTTFIPRIPHYDTRVRESFDDQPFGAHVGIMIDTLRPGFAELHLDKRPELVQQLGFFHGGLIGVLADNATGAAMMTLLAENEGMLTVEYKINFLSPATGDRLIARAEVLRHGRTLTTARCDVFSVENGGEKLCATTLFTLIKIGGDA